MISKLARIASISGFLGLAFLTMAPSNPSKAVFETSDKDGFKVSEIGLKNLDVEVGPIAKEREHRLSSSALVYLKDKVGVYRKRQDWFKLVFVEFKKTSGGEVLVSSPELAAGDSIVVKGAALLRVAESDAFGGEE